MKTIGWMAGPLLWGVLALSASAQTSAVEVAILKKPLAAFLDPRLGISVAVSGDTAVSGAYMENKGYVFREQSGIWQFEAALRPSDAVGLSGLVLAVAVEGDVAALGAPFHNHAQVGAAGAVYVFERSGTSWIMLQELNGPAGTYLGRSLALRGGTIFAGAPANMALDPHFEDWAGSGSGSVWTIEKVGGVWTHTATLQPNAPVAFDAFGFDVDADPGGQRIAVGAPGGANKNGAVYVFDYDAANQVWTQTHALSSPVQGDLFGMGVSVLGDTVAVGAPLADPGGLQDAGEAFVWRIPSNQVTALVPNVPNNTHFGELALALRASAGGAADELYVGGHWWSSNGGNMGGSGFGRGIAYAYRFDGGVWQEAYSFRGSDTANTYDNFGRSLATDGSRVFVGATGTDYDSHPNEGSVSVFEIAPQSAAAYGPSCPGTGGCAPQLAAAGNVQPGGSVTLSIANGYGGQPAVLLLGTHPGAVDLGAGCWVLLDPLLPVAVPLPPLQGSGPCVGTLAVPGQLPPLGDFWIGLQAAVGDPNQGAVLTNAVAIHLH